MTIKKSLLIWAFVSLVVVMVAFYGVFLSKTKVENFISNNENLIWTLSSRIPEDVNVKVKNGEIEVNKERPYCLMLESKSGLGVYFTNNDKPEPPKTTECGALMTVGKNYVMVPQENNTYKVYKINLKANYTINRSNIENFYKTNKSKLEMAVWSVFYAGSWMVWVGIFGWGLLTALWYAWVAKVALRIFQAKDSLVFNQVYGVSLFLMSGWWFLRYGLLYIIVDNFCHQNIWFKFPFMNTLILTILALIWYKIDDKRRESKK